jgi:hypothetical protein
MRIAGTGIRETRADFKRRKMNHEEASDRERETRATERRERERMVALPSLSTIIYYQLKFINIERIMS